MLVVYACCLFSFVDVSVMTRAGVPVHLVHARIAPLGIVLCFRVPAMILDLPEELCPTGQEYL